MGYTSQAGQVLLRSQPAQGTYAADIATAGVSVKLKSGSLGTSRDLLIPDPEIGGGRDVVDALLGAASWGGDYEFYARTDMLATLLKACLGTAAAPVTATGVTTHSITPVDSGTLPYLSIEENVGGSLETYQYTDAVVNTLHLECEANGYMQGTAGIMAAKQLAGAAKTAAPAKTDNSPLFVGTNITVQYNGVTLPAKSFSLDINNNMANDDFRMGSFYIGDLTAKRREITASFRIRESSSALWRQATYGLSTATQVGGQTQKQNLVITANSYDDIPAGTPPTKYQVQITIPNFVLTPYSLAASGDDIIESDLGGQAMRPSVGTAIMTAALKTGTAVIA